MAYFGVCEPNSWHIVDVYKVKLNKSMSKYAN